MLPETRVVRFGVAVVLSVALAACASAGGGKEVEEGRQRADPNRISQAELDYDPATDMWALIQRVRPRWLRPRGSSMAGLPAVILDGIKEPGGAMILNSIPAHQVREVRYLSAADATTRYGLDMIGGAIVIERKR